MPPSQISDAPDKKLYGIKSTGTYCESYGITHPIAEKLINQALNRELAYRGICFDYSNTLVKVTAFEQLPKKSGKLMLSKITIGDGSAQEDHLVISCIDDLGNHIEQDIARRLFDLNASVYDINAAFTPGKLAEIFESQKAQILRKNAEIAEKEFEVEVEKLENWSSDRKNALEIRLKDVDKKIRELKKSFRQPHTLDEKIELQRQQKTLDSERMNMRRKLFEAQDAIDAERDKLIETAEKSLHKPVKSQMIFAIDWKIL